jgi:hypothetical protein
MLSRTCVFMWLMGTGLCWEGEPGYIVKKVKRFSLSQSPAGMPLTKLSLAGNTWLGKGKSLAFFYSVLHFLCVLPLKTKALFFTFFTIYRAKTL